MLWQVHFILCKSYVSKALTNHTLANGDRWQGIKEARGYPGLLLYRWNYVTEMWKHYSSWALCSLCWGRFAERCVSSGPRRILDHSRFVPWQWAWRHGEVGLRRGFWHFSPRTPGLQNGLWAYARTQDTERKRKEIPNENIQKGARLQEQASGKGEVQVWRLR